jgi:hypothetical protein
MGQSRHVPGELQEPLRTSIVRQIRASLGQLTSDAVRLLPGHGGPLAAQDVSRRLGQIAPAGRG